MTEQAEKAAQEFGSAIPTSTHRYPVTRILLAINTVVFLCTWITAIKWPGVAESVVLALADWGPLTLGGQWWRPLTSMFVHAGIGHLLSNLLALWILGRHAELVLGRWDFLQLYLACGLAGSIASLAVHPEVTSGGASGAIFGLAGAVIIIYGLKGLSISRRALWKLAFPVLLVAYSIFPYAGDHTVNHAAHAGGLIAGLIIAGVLYSGLARSGEQKRWVFPGVAVALLLGAISVYHYKNYVVHLATARSAINHGRTEEGVRELDLVLQEKPDSPLANVLAAEAYLKKRDYPRAEAAARRSLAAYPDDDYATYLLGMVEMQTGRCEEASDMVRSRIHEGKSHHQAENVFGSCNHLAEGDRYLRGKQFDQAIAAYKEALKSEPGNLQAQLGLTKAYEMQKKAEPARTHN